MNSSSAGASLPTATSTSAGKSLLSRLKSPFSTKVRNWTDFSIQLDDPHRQYAPGDVVTGSVIIKVVKPVRITHIVVALHGFVQVFKNPNSPGDGYRAHNSAVATGKGPKKGGYFGNGFASLFEDEAVLCGEGRLAEGAYHFGFELEFPDKGLPSSIDVGGLVFITTFCKLILEKPVRTWHYILHAHGYDDPTDNHISGCDMRQENLSNGMY